MKGAAKQTGYRHSTTDFRCCIIKMFLESEYIKYLQTASEIHYNRMFLED